MISDIFYSYNIPYCAFNLPSHTQKYFLPTSATLNLHCNNAGIVCFFGLFNFEYCIFGTLQNTWNIEWYRPSLDRKTCVYFYKTKPNRQYFPYAGKHTRLSSNWSAIQKRIITWQSGSIRHLPPQTLKPIFIPSTSQCHQQRKAVSDVFIL